MAHQRKLIRNATVAQLLAAGTAAGSRIESTRMIPHRRYEGTALGVYTPEETVENTETRTAPRELYRMATLVIEGVVAASSGAEAADALDDLAEQVEAALDADDTLGRTCEESLLQSTDLEVAEDGQKTVGLLRLTYSAFYHQFAPTAVSAPDAFLTANVKTNLGGVVAPADQAEDTIHPEQ